jgi:HTH-type transcriptional regulator / antitoxin HigA
MKWNAIITKSQYEKAQKRRIEISQSLPGTNDDDELALLHILIRDYENRRIEMPGLGFNNPSFQDHIASA